MNVRNLIIGADLNRKDPQVCYYERDTGNTVTAPMKIGNDRVSFSDILEKLETRGLSDTDHQLEDEMTDIFRRALMTLGISDLERQTAGMMITVPMITKPLLSMVKYLYTHLGINTNRAFLQDYKESFYYHTMYQKKELYNRDVGLFEFSGDSVSFFSLHMNRRTKPITVTVTEGKTICLEGEKGTWDDQFYHLIGESLEKEMYTSIFLIGDSFDKGWSEHSVSLLCRNGRKVFVADSLFARGACCAAREKIAEQRLQEYLYLGADLVHFNVGMNMMIRNTETFYPLLSAGVNWYEAENTVECVLDSGKELVFSVSGMEDGRRHQYVMLLPELPDRPPRTTRLRLHLGYTSPRQCLIEAEDLGFGDMYPSSGRIWREIMEE